MSYFSIQVNGKLNIKVQSVTNVIIYDAKYNLRYSLGRQNVISLQIPFELSWYGDRRDHLWVIWSYLLQLTMWQFYKTIYVYYLNKSHNLLKKMLCIEIFILFSKLFTFWITLFLLWYVNCVCVFLANKPTHSLVCETM